MKYLSDVATFREDGRLKGFAEGEAKGRAEGILEGRLEGKEEGKTEGASSRALQIAQLMKHNGEPLDKIITYTGLSEDIVNSL